MVSSTCGRSFIFRKWKGNFWQNTFPCIKAMLRCVWSKSSAVTWLQWLHVSNEGLVIRYRSCAALGTPPDLPTRVEASDELEMSFPEVMSVPGHRKPRCHEYHLTQNTTACPCSEFPLSSEICFWESSNLQDQIQHPRKERKGRVCKKKFLKLLPLLAQTGLHIWCNVM